MRKVIASSGADASDMMQLEENEEDGEEVGEEATSGSGKQTGKQAAQELAEVSRRQAASASCLVTTHEITFFPVFGIWSVLS